MKKSCILLRAKNNKEFLVDEKLISSLREFVRTFEVELFEVIVSKHQKTQNLKCITNNICDANYQLNANYEIQRKIYPKNRDRSSMLKQSLLIRNYIEKQFMSKGVVSLKQIKSKFSNFNLTDACLCNHLSIVKASLSRKYKIEKIKAGTYKIK